MYIAYVQGTEGTTICLCKTEININYVPRNLSDRLNTQLEFLLYRFFKHLKHLLLMSLKKSNAYN